MPVKSVMKTLALLSRVIALLVAAAAPAAAQANIDTGWDRARVSQLTVTIRRAPSGPCIGAGFMVGTDDEAVYVVTAYEALQSVDIVPALPGDAPAGRAAPSLLVSTHPLLRLPAAARSLPATVLHIDADIGVGVLVIRDGAFARQAARLVSFDLVGDRAALVRADQVYALGCTETDPFVEWPPRPITTLSTRDDRIVFRAGDATDGRIGGPLVHVLGKHPSVVGLTTVFRERAEARGIDAIVRRLRDWKIPVMLRAPGSTLGCEYSLSFSRPPEYLGAVNMVQFSSKVNEQVTVTVDTQQRCSWTAYGDASDWMRVSLAGGNTLGPREPVVHTGPGTVTLTTAAANQCENNFRRGSVFVAGHVIPIGQDSTNLGICK